MPTVSSYISEYTSHLQPHVPTCSLSLAPSSLWRFFSVAPSSIQILPSLSYSLASFCDHLHHRGALSRLKPRCTCSLIHVSVLRLFFSSLIFKMTLLNCVSPGFPSPRDSLLLFTLTTALLANKFFPSHRQMSFTRFSASLRHLQIQLSLPSRCGSDSPSPTFRSNDRFRSWLRPGPSSSLRPRASSSSPLSPSVSLFLSTSLMFFSTLLLRVLELLLELLRETLSSLLPEKTRELPFASSAICSRRSFHSLLDLSLHIVNIGVSSMLTSITRQRFPHFTSLCLRSPLITRATFLTSLSFPLAFRLLDRLLLLFPLPLRLLNRLLLLFPSTTSSSQSLSHETFSFSLCLFTSLKLELEFITLPNCCEPNCPPIPAFLFLSRS